jgi:carbamoyltransferase
MQSQMNLKIKFRESFRPFAPVVRAERVADYFELDQESPYMLLVAPVRQKGLPAVTHVDNSARIQTLRREDNPRFYALLEAFEKLTGCPVLINTSFNVRGEPIVCTPDDAYRCLINTEMDYLIIGNFVLDRLKQPHKKIARTFDPIPD